MHDATDLYNAIKQGAQGAQDASKPCAVVFGTVTIAEPLTVNVEEKLTLSTAQLVLARGVTDYTTDMTVDHTTESTSGGSGESAYSDHAHAYVGRKEFLVHHTLLVGDRVVLLRMQGGQRYVILDRVVGV